MLRHKKILFICALLFSSFGHAKELEPLADMVRHNPEFITKVKDSQMLVSRCSALYLVLSVRLYDMENKKEADTLIRQLSKTAESYEEARVILSKTSIYSEQSTRFLQKDFAKKYAEITLANWKKDNDIFNPMIREDLKVCEDHAPYFKKFAKTLGREIKR